MLRLKNEEKPEVLSENEEAWNEEYIEWRKTKAGTEPTRYRHADVRDGLRKETRDKCAYCEARIAHVTHDHVEHKRPKSKFPELVCVWDNLTIGCPRCNQNKGDKYDPDCPILDPYEDDVENEIEFLGPLAIPRGGSRARITINLLQLNRKDLVFERTETLKSVGLLLDAIEQLTGKPDAQKAIWSELDLLIAPDAQFCAMVRDFLDDREKKTGLTRAS